MEKAQQLTPIIFGASGLLGGHLYQHFYAQNPNTVGTYGKHPAAGLQHFDLESSSLDDLQLDDSQNYTAIICASLTNIAQINAEPEQTAGVNVHATSRLMMSLHHRQIPILFISTDNVFPGIHGNYYDDNNEAAVSEYGIQKRRTESQLMSITDGAACVLRLAKIIGNSPDDGTLLNDIAKQLHSGEAVRAASDLIFNPTAIEDIINAIDYLIQHKTQGIYNFCNPDSYSRLELTRLMAKALNKGASKIEPILFSELDPSGKRPLNTSMVNSELFTDFSFKSIHTCIEEQVVWQS
ncbi:dTDP-4-dehydrorhamnose reductase [Pseudoalteromonas luteoviolacea]|uniref:dTDP-4-dehydrorhamnose reductase n=1 Tax=Pseudoalteromonas luteoviolacea TaxID=43657 RepID=A0A1C0TXB9_9GAMM|nr:sugar nucleotide-binding protein [Pseudoalteromonas luteoviolacea]OCQ23961.1 dTDP-4-dehydrorhamnose reductase [Pseudoalteromonas luteoviolacea]